MTWAESQRIAGWTASVALIVSVALAWPLGALSKFDPTKCGKIAEAAILGIWVIFPPIWFWYEYHYLYNPEPGTKKPDLEHFKHGQDQSAKIWIAAFTVLVALYFGNPFTHEASPAPGEKQKSAVTQRNPQESESALSTGASYPSHPAPNQR